MAILEYDIKQFGGYLKDKPVAIANKIDGKTEADIKINKAQTIGGTVKTVNNGDYEVIYNTVFATPQTMPLLMKLKSEGKWWLLPTEPLINVSGRNIVVKRNVAKKRDGGGSVKEYWTQDDWTIEISGLITLPNEEKWPKDDIQSLMKYCTATEPVFVSCEIFEKLGITRIVVDGDYSLPFTKGVENQNYTINAVSDKEFELFVRRQNIISK